MTSTLNTLIDARQVLADNAWTKGTLKRKRHDGTCEFCALGALGQAVQPDFNEYRDGKFCNLPFNFFYADAIGDGRNKGEGSDAQKALEAVLPSNYRVIAGFNDDYRIKKEDVLALYDRAILFQALTDARALIEAGYVKGTFEDEDGCFCAVGAVKKVGYKDSIGPSGHITLVRTALVEGVVDALHKALPQKYKSSTPSTGLNKRGAVYNFNDSTNQQFVLALFDTAISNVKESANA